MTNQFLLICFIWSSGILISSAQSMLEVGNTWIYEYMDVTGTPPPLVYEKRPQFITIERDTFFNNFQYFLVLFTESHDCGIHSYKVYLREDEGKIYRHQKDLQKDLLIYDFWATDFYRLEFINEENELDTAMVTIDSIGLHQFLDGTIVDVQHTTVSQRHPSTGQADWSTSLMDIYKNIGSFYFLPQIGIGLCQGYDVFTGLRCYHSAQLDIYDTPFPCDTTYTGFTVINTKDIVPIDLTIYPNPATGHLNVDHSLSQNFKITIYNAYGQVQQITNTQSRIELLGLAPGVYYLKLESKTQGAITKSFVKY